ncbi:xanthine dehydrogenase accessory protein XdhC [Sulfitobacter guttiformis]|uniref:Molybdenum cofactor sulfurylase n=1 Tax=Sulfitobacter guttiformis TaxID=74349 RepID=A0A420DU33_9RHOB|nr:xanthine dehydrogenase accessory protein XdhC [Sulfitobacter guttiformis]KIN71301.1 Xanthine dehydrogenase accessory protein XdhC [Sulfitobacter guttiformis KCTC 32187]RKE97755.1 molybdenum cofactor sulfurylase [Sulfitobacter guttiformis]
MTDRNTIYVEITGTRGSTPRDAGTTMIVTPTTLKHTIGGGALEYRAISKARKILEDQGAEESETIPLGPNLGQCCGGTVTLRYTYAPPALCAELQQVTVHAALPKPSQPRNLWIWGAGHVGRAVIHHAHPEAFNITWIDSSADRFPDHIPGHVAKTPAADMPLLATRAPASADHLIFTYSHDIDLALCAALLKRGAASIGLIGSATKWARFSKRLCAMGLDPSTVTCPIGDKTLGKHPNEIAQSTLRALLYTTQSKVSA